MQLNKKTVRKELLPPTVTTLINEQLIGCDPEFVMTKNGKHVYPFSPFGDNSLNKWNSWSDRKFDRFGCDGCLFELRPLPSRSTYDLTYGIKKLLATAATYLKDDGHYSWLANPSWRGRFCVGGHIHFGGDHTTPQEEAIQRVADCIEECDLIPKELSAARQRLYGQRMDTRLDHNDNGGHWEYRWLGTWLFHPKVAFSVLTLAKLSQVDTKKTVSLMDKRASGMAYGSLLKLADTYKDKDSDAQRLFNLLSLGPEKVLANPTRSFINYWLRWMPGRGVGNGANR